MSRRSVTIFTMLALIAWPVLGRADEKPAVAPAQTGAVTGLVVDRQGHPVARATVWGLFNQEKFGPTASGADGRFHLSDLKFDKPVTVWADAPGLARERRDDVRIFPGKDHDIGRLTLLPGTRISGRVVDAAGKPVIGAAVDLKHYRHQLGHTISSQGTEWTLSAGGDGRFTTPPLPAGSGHFSLSAPGKVRVFVQKEAEPGNPIVDLGDVTLPDEMPVTGVVTDAEGKPAPGVEVIPDYDWQNAAKTDKDGRFTVHGVGTDIKSLRIQSNDYFAPKAFDVAPGRTNLNLKVIKAYEIFGSAVDAETGKPVLIDTVRLCIVDHDPDDGHVTLRG
jgi:hypothetical protein